MRQTNICLHCGQEITREHPLKPYEDPSGNGRCPKIEFYMLDRRHQPVPMGIPAIEAYLAEYHASSQE